MVYRPADSIEVDWDDAGDYSHAAADVTADLDSYEVRYGIDAELDDRYLLYESATGALRLFSRDRKYDATNPGPALTAAQLLAPHLMRMRTTYVYGGATVVRERWEGIAFPPILQGREQTPVAELELEGRHALPLRAAYEPTASDTTLAEHAVRVGAALTPSGVSPEVRTPALTLNITEYEGTLAEFLDGITKMAGGWAFEGRSGDFTLVGAAEADAAGLSGMINPTDFRILAQLVEIEAAAGLVRNTANLFARIPVGMRTTAVAFNVVSDHAFTWTHSYRHPVGRLISARWIFALDYTQITVEGSGISNGVAWAYGNTSESNETYAGTIRVTVETAESVTLVPVREGASIAHFGERVIEFPGWFDATGSRGARRAGFACAASGSAAARHGGVATLAAHSRAVRAARYDRAGAALRREPHGPG